MKNQSMTPGAAVRLRKAPGCTPPGKDTPARRPAGIPVLMGFHPAGSSPAFFAGWQRELADCAEVMPVGLPGRSAAGGGRMPPLRQLVATLAERLEDRLDRPHVLFGYSMGALIAYRLARFRAVRQRRSPLRLLVAAFPAPGWPCALLDGGALTLRELSSLIDLRSLPASLRDDRRWMAQRLARVREDLRVFEGYRQLPVTPVATLTCPIDAFAGRDDPLVPVRDMVRWSACTTGDSALHVLGGDHFFVKRSRNDFFAKMRAILSGVVVTLRA